MSVATPIMNAPNPDESLSRTLAAWRVTPPRNPRFRAEVWSRLEAARHAPTWTGYVRAHGALVAGALMLAVVVGAWSGRERARERDAAARATLVAEYVHGLDARWMRLP
jgi:hypothetical protein